MCCAVCVCPVCAPCVHRIETPRVEEDNSSWIANKPEFTFNYPALPLLSPPPSPFNPPQNLLLVISIDVVLLLMIVRVFFNRMVYSITIPGHVCWGIVILCQVCSASLKAACARVCAPAPGTVCKLPVMFGVAGPIADALPTAVPSVNPSPHHPLTLPALILPRPTR